MFVNVGFVNGVWEFGENGSASASEVFGVFERSWFSPGNGVSKRCSFSFEGGAVGFRGVNFLHRDDVGRASESVTKVLAE